MAQALMDRWMDEAAFISLLVTEIILYLVLRDKLC